MNSTADSDVSDTPFIPINEDAIRSLRTYYCYMQAFSLCCHQDIIDRQKTLPAITRLQRSTQVDNEAVSKPLMRGWLTLSAMQALPLNQHPELAMAANFWAPVQAYYAVHGVGSAALAALRVSLPTDHRRFCASASDQFAKRLFPAPFNALCSGFDDKHPTCPTVLHDCSVTVQMAKNISNLTTPNRKNAPLLIAKSLLTTRRKQLEEQFEKARREKRKKRLSDEDKVNAAQRVHPTTVFDFLYRMRVRSNYDDPEMFIYGQTDTATARNHYSHLLNVTKTVILLLEHIIQRRCGTSTFNNFRQRFG